MAMAYETSYYSMLFFFLFFLFFSNLASINGESKGFSHVPLGREKKTHLHFYFHDIVSGPNATAFQVAKASTTNTSKTFFGSMMIIDDPLTEGLEITSKPVGRAQGTYAYASQSEIGLLTAFNFVLTEGKYKGSTLSVLGRNVVLSKVREMPIVGGTGVFRFARGYALARTRSLSSTTAVVEYNVYVFHY